MGFPSAYKHWFSASWAPSSPTKTTSSRYAPKTNIHASLKIVGEVFTGREATEGHGVAQIFHDEWIMGQTIGIMSCWPLFNVVIKEK